jgi:hypothetical protein
MSFKVKLNIVIGSNLHITSSNINLTDSLIFNYHNVYYIMILFSTSYNFKISYYATSLNNSA